MLNASMRPEELEEQVGKVLQGAEYAYAPHTGVSPGPGVTLVNPVNFEKPKRNRAKGKFWKQKGYPHPESLKGRSRHSQVVVRTRDCADFVFEPFRGQTSIPRVAHTFTRALSKGARTQYSSLYCSLTKPCKFHRAGAGKTGVELLRGRQSKGHATCIKHCELFLQQLQLHAKGADTISKAQCVSAYETYMQAPLKSKK